MNEFQNKHITVMGLGRSGVAVAKILKDNGAHVFGSDNSQRDDIVRARDQLHALNIECEIGRHSSRVYDLAEMIVLSPGIPTDIPILREASAKGIPTAAGIKKTAPAAVMAVRLSDARAKQSAPRSAHDATTRMDPAPPAMRSMGMKKRHPAPDPTRLTK